MRITANEQRTGGAVRGPVLDDGLRDSQNVGLVESPVERRTTVPRGAEDHLLSDVLGVWLDRVVRHHQVGQIDEVFGQCRLTGARVGHGYSFCPYTAVLCSLRKRTIGTPKGNNPWHNPTIASWLRYSPAVRWALWPARP